MTEAEFKALRHLAWDLDPWGDGMDDVTFCICTTPEVHARYRMDPDGGLAKAALQ